MIVKPRGMIARMFASAAIAMVLVLVPPSARGAAVEAALPTASVGISGELKQIVLPGSPLVVRTDWPKEPPLVVRIRALFVHGTDHRYDIVFYGLEPGQYDLREYLRRADGGTTADLPPLPVAVVPLLPPGQVEPHAVALREVPRLGSYRTLLIAAGSLWIAGLLLIAFAKRRTRRTAALARQGPTLADQLRPLVSEARAGTLSAEKRAELERLLLTYWRQQRNLTERPAAEALRILRLDAEAGPLLTQLERWLHAPASDEVVDVAALLQPYEHVAAGAPAGAAGAPHRDGALGVRDGRTGAGPQETGPPGGRRP